MAKRSETRGRRRTFFERLEPRAMLAVAPLPTVSIADARIIESNSGAKTLSFVVSLSSAARETTSVGYTTVDGSATTTDFDYAARTGIASFRAGQRTAMISIVVRGDRAVEADETFQVVLADPINAVLGRSSATGFILDDDAASRTVTLAGPSGPVNEGSPATFTFTLSRSSLSPVTLSYATSNGSASSSFDYTAAIGSLTFAPGETSKTVGVATLTDSTVEADEVFQMRISSVSGAMTGTPSTASVTIKDVPPVIPPTPTGGGWTILVYMTGENLNTYARDDINEMEKALVSMPAGVKIVVSWDQPKSGVGSAYATGGGTQSAWRTYGRSVLTADSSTTRIASTFDLSFGERNTGDPATLVDFVKWGVQKAPAQKYLLQMWGHGGGLDGSQFDSESGDDALTIGEMASALSATGMPTIDLVSYDNCLMAMAELGAAIAPKVNGLFVASEELVNGTGQDYLTAYSALKVANSAGVTAAQVAAGMVASYQTQYQGDIDRCDTFSAATSSGYAVLTGALKQFVDASSSLGTADRTTLRTAATNSVAYDTTSFRDLGSFMTKVLAATSLPQPLRTAATAVSSAISAMVPSKTADQRNSSGIAVYLPTSSTDAYLSSYQTDAAAFCQATGWNTFAKWLATGTRSISATSGLTAISTRVIGSTTKAADRGFSREQAVAAAWGAFGLTGDKPHGDGRGEAKPRSRPVTIG
jgi:hypothetical protein